MNPVLLLLLTNRNSDSLEEFSCIHSGIVVLAAIVLSTDLDIYCIGPVPNTKQAAFLHITAAI